MDKICKYLIGVDSGGSKCDVIITDTGMRRIASGTFKSEHLSEKGTSAFTESLLIGINNILEKHRIIYSEIAGICIGVAGARNNDVKTAISRLVSKSMNFRNVLTVGDTEAAIQGAFGDDDGIVLICGTGSILFGRINNKIFRAGGWGKILGDYGSGYDLGRKAIMKLVRDFDLSAEETLFSVKIKKIHGIDKSAIINKIYHGHFPLHSLAPLVIECAAMNDENCRDVVNTAVDELIYLIRVFFKTTRRRKKIKLALLGGIIENDNFLSGKLKSAIGKRFGNKIEIIKPEQKPAFGSALIAKKSFV